MRSFLVLFDEMPIDKSHVKKGENSPEVITAARCVNVGLFLSNDLRRDVSVIFGINNGELLNVIRFDGETLRRVSPDERSVAFFLLKAFTMLEEMVQGSEKTMDNGIILKRTTLENLIAQWPYGQVFVASSEAKSSIWDTGLSEGLFIYHYNDDSPVKLGKFGTLERPKTCERFILDINLHFDSIK